ncbi:hypothetical protein K435DRAFT_796346 [Dendrothele bispora CBS 962.96]|uniref:Uncharacterized protein n=1 Tax=Dendrothele bispora (strain CBS 962.96) TaxID=1314807 RepID=A0A4S8M761_DENBC|nr:hypothetical protein K435DRAFT_796346 [Dendrothele bispora CBS 962.96]
MLQVDYNKSSKEKDYSGLSVRLSYNDPRLTGLFDGESPYRNFGQLRASRHPNLFNFGVQLYIRIQSTKNSAQYFELPSSSWNHCSSITATFLNVIMRSSTCLTMDPVVILYIEEYLRKLEDHALIKKSKEKQMRTSDSDVNRHNGTKRSEPLHRRNRYSAVENQEIRFTD